MDHLHWTLISGPLVDHPVAESFGGMPRCILFGAFLFRPERQYEKVISVSSHPFGARICLQFGVLNTLLAAVFAKLWADF